MSNQRTAPTTYDEVQYLSKTYPESHPDRLWTAARLLGLSPTPPSQARVLELGCATGGNLLPMAMALPTAEFVGLDLSSTQIEAAEARRVNFGVENLRFFAMDLADVDASLGDFDYIIAHGVYSWIPASVQARLIEVVRERLRPQGVGFISYNAMPGWGLRGAVRELMVWGGGQEPDALARLKRAREVLELATRLSPSNSAFGLLLREEASMLRKLPDSYVRHDFLAERNEALWFHEMLDRLEAGGLRFLCEATFSERQDFDLPPAAREALEPLRGDPERWEQYKDLIRNRGFRENLVVRADAPTSEEPTPERVREMVVVGNLDVVGEVDLAAPGDLDFKTREGAVFGVEAPILKAALAVLSERRPAGMPFEALVDEAHARLGYAQAERVARRGPDSERLAANLLYSYSAGLIELGPRALPCEAAVPERPTAWRCCRLLAAEGGEYIPTLRHESFVPTPFDRALFSVLDGTRDHEALVDALAEMSDRGEVRMSDMQGEAFADPAALRTALTAEIATRLPQLQRFAMLESRGLSD